MNDGADAYVLQATGIAKSFSGFMALDGLTLSVRSGAIHAIIGPNGAGKTTLLGVLSGFVRPTAGEVRFAGVEITHAGAAEIAQMGMVRSFQITSIFAHMTALENVKVALQARTNLSRRLLAGSRVTAVLDEPARDALHVAGLDDDRNTVAANLPYGKKRGLELAIAISQDPSVLLLDEPTAGMGAEDIGPTIELIRRVSRDRTVVLVEHNLRVVEHLCDRVSVLERGKVLTEGGYAEVRADPRVVEAYLGAGRH
ncbi:MAG TPA: ABC transporter ATP-binding protein [Candidatus Baltobacteraceae bacterium]|nr:ABC transporter ATP-binding protein [Candidatus Baltobacteraceae bacterium]